jgi:hypothetical protein
MMYSCSENNKFTSQEKQNDNSFPEIRHVKKEIIKLIIFYKNMSFVKETR